jgi:hypothetical protein
MLNGEYSGNWTKKILLRIIRRKATARTVGRRPYYCPSDTRNRSSAHLYQSLIVAVTSPTSRTRPAHSSI